MFALVKGEVEMHVFENFGDHCDNSRAGTNHQPSHLGLH